VNFKKSIGIYILLGGLILMIYSACNNPASTNENVNSTGGNIKTAHKPNLIELLVGNGNNLFRSVDLGTDFKTVLGSERKIPDENDTDDITYTLPIDTLKPDSVNEAFDSVNYFTITYYFQKDKLNQVEEDIYLETDSIAANLNGRLTDYFTSKYGQYASGNDSRVWNTMRKGKKEWITLSDQSEEYDGGKLSLVFYSEDY
jgi:hypothetical protein